MLSNEISITLVTGLSGAGKTQAMKALEDLGFFCIDNMPPALLKDLVTLAETSAEQQRFAVAVDVRGKEYFSHLFTALDWLEQSGHCYQILFLDCQDPILVRRFSETRRKHPLQERGSIYDSIAAERQLLSAIREQADEILDTSRLKPLDLKVQLNQALTGRPLHQLLPIDLFSFGFKFGVPLDADIVFDVRFVDNPYYIEELRDLSGLDRACADYVLQDKAVAGFLDRFAPLLLDLIPAYAAEGKARLSIGIGCTGGRHRSVAVAVELGKRLQTAGLQTTVRHRELEGAPGGAGAVE